MMPDKHILWGLLFSLALFIVGIEVTTILVIFAATILIDIDHVIYYMVRFKKCNIDKMNKYFRSDACLENLSNPLPIFIFHNFETILILIILSRLFPITLYILAGIWLHMMLDWKVMPTSRYPAIIKLSLIGVLIENKRRKRGSQKW